MQSREDKERILLEMRELLDQHVKVFFKTRSFFVLPGIPSAPKPLIKPLTASFSVLKDCDNDCANRSSSLGSPTACDIICIQIVDYQYPPFSGDSVEFPATSSRILLPSKLISDGVGTMFGFFDCVRMVTDIVTF